jgi:hypothetical protein
MLLDNPKGEYLDYTATKSDIFRFSFINPTLESQQYALHTLPSIFQARIVVRERYRHLFDNMNPNKTRRGEMKEIHDQKQFLEFPESPGEGTSCLSALQTAVDGDKFQIHTPTKYTPRQSNIMLHI